MSMTGWSRKPATLLTALLTAVAALFVVGPATSASAEVGGSIYISEAPPYSQMQIIPGSTASVRGAYWPVGATVTLTSPDGTMADTSVVVGQGGEFSTSMQVSATLPCSASVVVYASFADQPTNTSRGAMDSTLCEVHYGLVYNLVDLGTPFAIDAQGFAVGEGVTLSSDSGHLDVGTVTSGPDGKWAITETLRAPTTRRMVTVTARGTTSGRTSAVVLDANSAVLWPGETLRSYEQIRSPSSRFLVFLGARNLLIQGPPGEGLAIGPGNNGSIDTTLAMQTDGNLVMYAGGRAAWSTGTAGTGPNNRLVMQDDGNLVLYNGGRALWSSGLPRPTLTVGQTLRPGQSLYPYSREPRLIMQGDGNLVLYGPNSVVEWYSHTAVAGAYLVLQGDGNLVIYAAGRAVWSTRTNGSGNGCRLIVQDDGNVVLYSATNRALWSTGTSGRV